MSRSTRSAIASLAAGKETASRLTDLIGRHKGLAQQHVRDPPDRGMAASSGGGDARCPRGLNPLQTIEELNRVSA